MASYAEHNPSRSWLAPAVYALIVAAVSVYVALATGYRSEVLPADAWEHHRVVRVMAELGAHAGNPTYATPEPSIRASPYSLALAWLCRATGLSAYDALSAAAVASTVLLGLSLWLVLAALGEARAAPWVLLSAGVDYDKYKKQVEMAMKAGASSGYWSSPLA